MQPFDEITRREFAAVTTGAIIATAGTAEAAEPRSEPVHYALSINGQHLDLELEPRVTLLDLLRERLHLSGTKKGCDHGQCGACTVLVNGKRVNSCLTLAISAEGSQITTIEGMADRENLHPMQAAFIKHDGFQCGFCTPGQICSAVAMLDEWAAGMPSAVSPAGASVPLNEPEVRERMAGNICRCGAYPNIVAAVLEVHQQRRERNPK